ANGQPILTQAAERLGALGTVLGGWKLWGLFSVILGFFPVAGLVDLATFVRAYLLNVEVGDEPGLRDRIRRRVLDTLGPVMKNPDYARVTLVAHSFGAIVAMDVAADYALQPGAPRLEIVTLGSPAKLLSLRSQWLQDETLRCDASPSYARWSDF